MEQAAGKLVARVGSHTLLTDGEKRAFVGMLLEQKDIKAHADYVGQREAVESLCLIVKGLLARTITTLAGKRQITAFYLPGEIPNLPNMMLPSSPTALLAVIPTSVVTVKKSRLVHTIAAVPAIGEALWRETVLETMTAAEWAANLGQRKGEVRLAHLFCEIATRSGMVDQVFDFSFPITQSALAEATGMSAVHVNRCMQSLRRRGFMKMEGGIVSVADWNGLCDFGEFDAHYLRLETPVRYLV